MADHTSHYNLTKPVYGETVDVQDINGNMDTLDAIIYDADQYAQSRVSDAYDATQSYAVGDFCIHENELYKCITATTGTWDSTAWALTNIAQAFEPKRTWRLFETLTADGTSGRIESILPPKCTGVIMKYHLTASATDSAGFHSVKFVNESGRLTFNYLTAIVTNADRYGEARIIADGNFWQAEFTSAGTNATSTLTEYSRQNAFKITDAFLENIRFDTTGTPSVNIPSGSTFEIYVRQ